MAEHSGCVFTVGPLKGRNNWRWTTYDGATTAAMLTMRRALVSRTRLAVLEGWLC